MPRSLPRVASVGTLLSLAACSSAHHPAEGVASRAAAQSTCTTATAGDGWSDTSIATQTGHFLAEADVSSSVADVDGVVGFASSQPAQYTDLAAILRFNDAGAIDVRRGGGYAADAYVPYSPNQIFHVLFDVDVPAHAYSVTITPPGGSPVALATRYAFRTEQAGASQLAWLGAYIDTASGVVDACNLTTRPAPVCMTTGAPDAWSNSSFTPSPPYFTIALQATPNAPNLDAVIGLANGPAHAYTDLAAIVRFNDQGKIDVRHGGAYTADASFSYSPGVTYRIWMDVDLYGHQYGVRVAPPGGQPTTLATRYPFRTEQASASTLNDLAAMIDVASGTITACDEGVTASAPGILSVTSLPAVSSVTLLPNGGALASTPPAWSLPNGQTSTLDAKGSVVATAPHGGMVRVDAAGDVVLAGTFTGSIDMGTGAMAGPGDGSAAVYVAKYSSSWSPRWAETFAAPAGAEQLSDVAVDANGDVALATTARAILLAPDGSASWTRSGAATGVAFDPAGEIVTLGPTPDTPVSLTISVVSPSGSTRWQRSFQATRTQNTDPLILDPERLTTDAGGDVILTGEFAGHISFGGPSLYYPGGTDRPDRIGFVAKLAPDGSFVFSETMSLWLMTGLATNGSGEIVLAGRTWADPPNPTLVALGPAGDEHYFLQPLVFGPDLHGTTGEAALDANGVAWWAAVPMTSGSPSVVRMDP